MGRMKGGSRKVKWIMIQAANAVIRTDPRMRAYYERKLRRHHHNVAVTHVANKMLRIIWHMPTGAGTLFGIAIGLYGNGVYFVDDGTNALSVLR